LTDDQVKYIESQNSFDVGFPMNFVGENPRETGGYNTLAESLLAAKVSFEKPSKPAGYE
jgi:hypothetical protein